MSKITPIDELMKKFNDRHKDKPEEPEGGAPASAPAPPAVDGSGPEGTPDGLNVNIEDVHVALVVTMDADGINVLPLKPKMDLELAEVALTFAVRRVQEARQAGLIKTAIMNLAGQRQSGLVVPTAPGGPNV